MKDSYFKYFRYVTKPSNITIKINVISHLLINYNFYLLQLNEPLKKTKILTYTYSHNHII